MLQQLPLGVRCLQRDEAGLLLMVPAGMKMDALRALLAMTDVVRDVEVTAPGLQELYGQLVDTADDDAAEVPA